MGQSSRFKPLESQVWVLHKTSHHNARQPASPLPRRSTEVRISLTLKREQETAPQTWWSDLINLIHVPILSRTSFDISRTISVCPQVVHTSTYGDFMGKMMINPGIFGVSNLKISDKSICRNIDISIKPAFLVVKPSFLSRKNGGLPPHRQALNSTFGANKDRRRNWEAAPVRRSRIWLKQRLKQENGNIKGYDGIIICICLFNNLFNSVDVQHVFTEFIYSHKLCGYRGSFMIQTYPLATLLWERTSFYRTNLRDPPSSQWKIPKSPSPHDDQRYWATSKIGNS